MAYKDENVKYSVFKVNFPAKVFKMHFLFMSNLFVKRHKNTVKGNRAGEIIFKPLSEWHYFFWVLL